MEIGRVFLDVLVTGDRLCSLDAVKVTALAESMAEIGLQQPITVWSLDDDTCDLVSGLHRLEAAKVLLPSFLRGVSSASPTSRDEGASRWSRGIQGAKQQHKRA